MSIRTVRRIGLRHLPIFDEIPKRQMLHCGRADLDDGSSGGGGNGAQQLWMVAVNGGCGTTAVAVAVATAHSNCGWWQRTPAVGWDAAGRTNSERLLLWTTAAAVPAETAHSNCERLQLMAAVEWDAAGPTDGERHLLWTMAAAVPAVAVTMAAADSNWGRWLWLGTNGSGQTVHIWQKWQVAVSTKI